MSRRAMRAAGLVLTLALLGLGVGRGVRAQSLDAGKKAYEECVACHAVEKGVNGVGPSLSDIVGAKAGSAEGFRFSGPMKRSGIVWSLQTLDQYIADPQAVVPGTRMPYSGMPDAAMRAALVNYLATLK